jgi:hypothetical protein
VLALLVALALLLTAADHWTTWLCLRAPVAGFEVGEGNPLAAWLFGRVGLVPGILIDSAVSLCGAAFLLATPLVPRVAKALFFSAVVLWTGWAVANNLNAIARLGIPLGGPG